MEVFELRRRRGCRAVARVPGYSQAFLRGRVGLAAQLDCACCRPQSAWYQMMAYRNLTRSMASGGKVPNSMGTWLPSRSGASSRPSLNPEVGSSVLALADQPAVLVHAVRRAGGTIPGPGSVNSHLVHLFHYVCHKS